MSIYANRIRALARAGAIVLAVMVSACGLTPQPGYGPAAMAWSPAKTDRWTDSIREQSYEELLAEAEAMYARGTAPERAYYYYGLYLELRSRQAPLDLQMQWLERAAMTPLYWTNIRTSNTGISGEIRRLEFTLPGLPEAQFVLAQLLLRERTSSIRARELLVMSANAGYEPAARLLNEFR